MDSNEVKLLGTLQAPPDVRTAQDGATVMNLRLLTELPFIKDGEEKIAKEFHRVVLFGKLADNASTRLKEGSTVIIDGRLQTREFESEGVKRSMTEIVARNFNHLTDEPGANIPHENKAQIVGHVGQDPKIGNNFMSFSVATNEVFGGTNGGDRKEKTTWHDVTVFGENMPVEGSVAKGGAVVISGPVHTRSWEKDGQKHYRTGIVADSVSPFTPPAVAPEQNRQEENTRRTSRNPAPFA